MKFSSITTLVSAAAVVLSPAVNAISGGYWPVSTPSTANPWVIGQPNSVVWGMGGDLGITEFDMQLHNFNKSIMTGFLLVAQNVPVQKWASGSKKTLVSFTTRMKKWRMLRNLRLKRERPSDIPRLMIPCIYCLAFLQKGQYGGELAVSLPDAMATGNGFSLLFMDTKSGEVYFKTDKFPIYAAASSPSNYTTAELPSGTPATTAVITAMPNPTQAWGITVGVAAATGTVANQAGQAGSGSS
ncbi:hypothetical protein QFC22_005067 [Naganishia vaughanmartiniae]|uniref:Uncharacterized protein n=1 Tax=Naganishia vaughanmartiniae TaxID=1424756 RepID=A0ACC2WXP1_9TREE|nr:hypothetical protein QFC22_005067 [Naganishia vaughanmartiniae]